MNALSLIKETVVKAVAQLYNAEINIDDIICNVTRKEFDGDYTIVVFPYSKIARKKPEAIGEEIGNYLNDNLDIIVSHNTIKGFLNLVISDAYWLDFTKTVAKADNFGYATRNGEKVMVEFSSPNTNKPLHLGHIRNILLGWSTSRILDAAGYDVVKVQIINDRGIHICKSMLAWMKYGDGETPESSGMKGDHLVGKYYVLYSKEEKAQKAELEKQGKVGEEAPILTEARELLRKWETGDPETIALWENMNSWVYDGFEQTYKALGVHFDKYYYESETYLLGKDIVDNGLEKGIFYQKEDCSVWIDLEDVKLDHKLVLRSDGTSVYMTQDLGTANLRFSDFGTKRMVYVVGNEQDYHFKVLFEILKRLGEPYADGLYHLSYGMVNLPEGRMKSREGTVVDADDMMAEVIDDAESQSKERGGLEGITETEKQSIWKHIGMAALKYHILKVQPKKTMVYDPAESLDMQGQTGPYIQNAFVRCSSVGRKSGKTTDLSGVDLYTKVNEQEKDILRLIHQFPDIIAASADEYDPSGIAHFAYDLAKAYHRFWHDVSILKAETEMAVNFRLILSQCVADVLRTAMDLLGIGMPDRM